MTSVELNLDLDRTAVKTGEFDKQKWSLLQRWYPKININAEAELANQRKFYVKHGTMEYYDFSGHLRALGLPDKEVFERLSNSELADGRFEYEGLPELLDWAREHGTVQVLTFGEEPYQRLKSGLCPSLRDIEIITTMFPKGEFFMDRQPQPEVQAWMVDDKPIGHELPWYVKFIQVTAEYNDVSPSARNEAPWLTAVSLAAVLDKLKSATDASQNASPEVAHRLREIPGLSMQR